MKIFFTLVLMVFSQISCAALPALPSASIVGAQIEQRGAHAVAQELYEDKNQWSELLKKVSSGSHEWLVVAGKLRPGTDAGSSEMLEVAIFFSLANATTESLRMISLGTFSLDGVCSSNFLIDTPANKKALDMIDVRIAKLAGVKDADLLATRDHCIENLKHAKSDVIKVVK